MMRNTKTISIITVCWNSAKTIQSTLESVRENKSSKVEYIVIDGGSTDSTTQIINSNIDIIDHFISEQDRGIYEAMKKGAAIAKGDYLYFLNSDDRLAPNVISQVLQRMENSNYKDLYCGNVSIVDAQGNVEHVLKSKLRRWKRFYFYMPAPHPGFFVKKTIFDRLLGLDTSFRIASDFDFLLRCLRLKPSWENLNLNIIFFASSGISSQGNNQMEDVLVWKKNRYPTFAITIIPALFKLYSKIRCLKK